MTKTRNIMTEDFNQKTVIKVDLYDLNGTLDNGEYCFRELIWRPIILSCGNVIYDKYTGLYSSITQKEKNLEDIKRHNDLDPLNWEERWNGKVDTWYGSGNEYVHAWLVARGYISPDSEFADFRSVDEFINKQFKAQIAKGKLQFRPGIKELFALRAVQGRPRAVITNDSRELVEAKFAALGLRIDESAIHDPLAIQFVITPDQVGNLKKPDGALYVAGITKMWHMLGKPIIHAAVFEDSPAGLEAACRAQDEVAKYGHQIERVHFPYTLQDKPCPYATHRIEGDLGGSDYISPEYFMVQILDIDLSKQSCKIFPFKRAHQ